jgi:hypothetical protein
MAIQAAFAQQSIVRTAVRRKPGAAPERARMKSFNMTVIAQEGCPLYQHPGLGTAVGIMAIGAIFPHRLVFPQERATLFSVALVTGFIDGVLDQQGPPGGAVRIMAI